jgi:hypothetical protein
MPLVIAMGIIALVVLWERQGRAGRAHGAPLALPPRPPGMPPPQYWPQPPPGPASLPTPAWPTVPAAPGPAPLPGCASQQWHLPAQREIPKEVTDRAVEILRSPAVMGSSTIEQVAGRVWRFQVEIHGANDQNPNPHRGVGVRLCV